MLSEEEACRVPFKIVLDGVGTLYEGTTKWFKYENQAPYILDFNSDTDGIFEVPSQVTSLVQLG